MLYNVHLLSFPRSSAKANHVTITLELPSIKCQVWNVRSFMEEFRNARLIWNICILIDDSCILNNSTYIARTPFTYNIINIC